MDRSSEDVFKELLESISGSRVFQIFTYRPEFVHTWGSRSYHSQVTLNKLSNRESLAMVSYLLNTTNVDKEIEDLTLSKTEGIPFFIEEFIKSLKELRIIEKSNGTFKPAKDLKAISIPSSIQDVIMARVDHLQEGAREVLRTGSVIEREFSHDLIQKVTGLPEQQLLSNLSTLRDSELLYERGIYPNSTYIFKHALTREVVYDSILTKSRKQIHATITRTIEELFMDNICDYYGVLAGHCIASENYEKGAEYARLEAKRYQKKGLFKDAIEYAKKRVSSLEKLPQTETSQKKVIDARTSLANYHLYLNFHRHAREAVEPIMDLALKLNYRKRLPAIYTAIGLYHLWVEEDSHKGLVFIDKATPIAEEVADYLSWWVGLYQSGSSLPFYLEFKEAHKRLKNCLDFSLLENQPAGITFSKGSISVCYLVEGKINPAYEAAQEALDLAKETGDAFIKGMAYSAYGAACFQKGLFDEAKAHLLEWVSSYEKLSPISWITWAYAHLGSLHFEFREYDDAMNCFKKLTSILENFSFSPSSIKLYQTSLVRAKVLRHDQNIELAELFAVYQHNKLAFCEGCMARNIGDILLHIDDDHHSDAELWFKRAIEADSRNGMRWQLAADHACYADWFKKRADVQGAEQQLTKAIDLFRECGADGWVTKYEQEMAKLA